EPPGGVAPAIPTRSRPRRSARSVTVDSSKARTSLEALKLSLRALRWKEFPFGRRLPCDIYWHAVSFHDNVIYSGQVNKFPGMTEMARKANLSRAMRTMQELFPEEYNFYPRSWILPEEFVIFVTEVNLMKENNPRWKPTFIVKPDGGCQGDGIYLVKEPAEIRLMGNLQSRPAVVQEYMAKPFLIDKLKFDIRLYVLLKSLDPLEVHVAKDGLCRFCTEPYQEPALNNLHQVYMHLTNYSLNIHSGNFVHSDSGNTGSKRTFSSILAKLAYSGVNIRKVWSDIISLVIKTVIAIVPELKVFHQSDIPAGKPGPSCFQILGFDILLMKNLKPILLEVNANPSMKIEHEQERHKSTQSSPFAHLPSSSSCPPGMSLQGFVEAICLLAQRRYKSLSLHEQVELLLDYCEYNLAALDEKRLACSRSLSSTQATLVTCPQDQLQLSPATPASAALHRRQKFVDCRSSQP
ncbi:PREDICTED: tubulin polyglutamylase TTLL11, partial [Thamnophis sirtalis]|uniref:Tubulin polyglutamylase TTLL11 n=1 Tax=Thamnophis sirtalis TaxID=35019 RepID=A0A6I9YI80_9SAUR